MSKTYVNKKALAIAKTCKNYEEFFKYLEKNEVDFDLHLLDNPMQPDVIAKNYVSKERINYLYHLNDEAKIDGGVWGDIEGVITKKRITKEYDSLGEPVYYPEYYIKCGLWFLKDHWYKEEAITLIKSYK